MSEPSHLPPVDVCVVGAGPAGLAVARALADAGRSVLLLDSGGERRAGRASRRARALNAGETAGEPYAGLMATRHRGLGGTAHLWNVDLGEETGAKYVPLSPDDFAAWPIGFETLVPWYEAAQEVCGLGPFAYDADDWATPDRTPFDLDGTGLHSAVYQFGGARRFTRELVDELRGREGVTVAAFHTVVEVLAGPHGRCRGVRVATFDGGTSLVPARATVLATGAVENARLLLVAGAVGTGWLGRGFMEHARDFSLGLEPRDRDLFTRAGFYDLHRAEDGTRVGGRLAPTPDARLEYDLPGASITLVPRARPVPGRGVVSRVRRRLLARRGLYWAGRYGWSGLPHPDRVLEAFDLVLNLEHEADRENRVELDGRTDRFGVPLPRLRLRWSEAEQRRLERLRRLLAEWFDRAGLGRLRITAGHRPDLGAHHHAGTTRMADTPGDGVVDPDCRVFGYDNLFVAGASVFPSAGFANPTLTTVAMALRLADRVSRDLG